MRSFGASVEEVVPAVEEVSLAPGELGREEREGGGVGEELLPPPDALRCVSLVAFNGIWPV